MLKRPSERGAGSLTVQATPRSTTLQYVGVEIHHITKGHRFAATVDERHEQALILLQGCAEVSGDGLATSRLAGRESVFDPISPYVVYVSSNSTMTLEAETDCEIAWASAVLEKPSAIPSRIYSPQDMPLEDRGEGMTARHVRHLLEEPGQAMSLRLVEVITPGGHWSSFPPHKHDQEIPGVESLLEELYYYHVAPSDLWAFQRVYDRSGWGEALAVHDGDLVMVPRGYHPVAAPPGATVYYLNVMAGPTRQWNFTIDPNFSHVPGFVVPGTKEGA